MIFSALTCPSFGSRQRAGWTISRDVCSLSARSPRARATHSGGRPRLPAARHVAGRTRARHRASTVVPIARPDEAPGEVADPPEAVPCGGCYDRRGALVLGGLEQGWVLNAEGNADPVHPLHRVVHGRIITDRAFRILEAAAELPARPPGVADEQAHMIAVGEQPPGDARRSAQSHQRQASGQSSALPSRGPKRCAIGPPMTSATS